MPHSIDPSVSTVDRLHESFGFKSLVGGEWVDGDGTFPVNHPYSGTLLAEVARTTRKQIAHAVGMARGAFPHAPPPYERASILAEAAKRIDARRRDFIELIMAEAGFTEDDAAGEVSRGLDTLHLCAEEAKRICGEMVPLNGNPGQQDRLGFTIRTPVGVVCAITPFNSPFNTVLHKLAPAIAAGNAVILKPSPHTPLTAAFLCQIFLDVGLAPGLLALVNGDSDVGSWLLDEQDINFYTFTGSTRVGRLIQTGAGLRRTQLELGSIAATIVCADADLDGALPKIARASFRKAGQVCTSVQRLYVADGVLEDVRQRLVQLATGMPAGDPYDPETKVGPMISRSEAERAESWIEEAAREGATIEYGGRRRGSVLEPTVVAGVRSGMKVVDKEIFAPVVSILPMSSLESAIADINAMPYGLATGIFTRELSNALMAAKSINAGSVHVNETSSSRVDGMPYGGMKESGFGREGPKYAIREMTDEKVITMHA